MTTTTEHLERRALFNALRADKWDHPDLDVPQWQVIDYRALEDSQLYQSLSELDISLNRDLFLSYAEKSDSPEELSEQLVADASYSSDEEDLIYLLIFELWRRFLPEKRCLSLFCDELDTQIFLYDRDLLDNPQPLEDALANLIQVLEDQADAGEDPTVLYQTICGGCANDLESFFYDFVSERIDHGNDTYASELLDSLEGIVSDPKWFQLLQARLLSHENTAEANQLLTPLIRKTATDKDLEFNFEMLRFLFHEGERHFFLDVTKNTIPILEAEEDLADLLYLCRKYYQLLDNDKKEKTISDIIDKRSSIPHESPINPKDPDFKELRKVLRNTA